MGIRAYEELLRAKKDDNQTEKKRKQSVLSVSASLRIRSCGQADGPRGDKKPPNFGWNEKNKEKNRRQI